MSTNITENQKALAEIIYSRDSFTAREVVAEYKRVRHSNIVDLTTTVAAYLDILVEFGAIRQSEGRYIVRSKGIPIKPTLCSCVD
jgi:hypothetical protein